MQLLTTVIPSFQDFTYEVAKITAHYDQKILNITDQNATWSVTVHEEREKNHLAL